MELSIIITEDGSHSLRNEKLQETYHSVHGAVRESNHVFIQHGFDHYLKNKPSSLRIFEAGFGTGLNALLTAVRTAVPVYYESWELYPLPMDIVRQLNYGDQLTSTVLFQMLHEAPWNQNASISPEFVLHKRVADLLQIGRAHV